MAGHQVSMVVASRWTAGMSQAAAWVWNFQRRWEISPRLGGTACCGWTSTSLLGKAWAIPVGLARSQNRRMTTNRTPRRALAAAAVALSTALTVAACGSGGQAGSSATADTTTMADKTSMPGTATMAGTTTMAAKTGDAMATGMYLSHADYQQKMSMLTGQGSRVVLFFHAPWCPDCRGTDSALSSSGVPAGLVVVKVDYDSATELRQRYGVTQQHTFVLVDGQGNAVKKWSGAKDGAAIAAAVG